MALIKLPPELTIGSFTEKDPDYFKKLAHPAVQAFSRQVNDAYVPWDKFRYWPFPPDLPADLSREAIWAYLRLVRDSNLRPLPLRDDHRGAFAYSLPASLLRVLNEIDRTSGGIMGTDEPDSLPSRERYVVSSLMEEAIASSQLEGAATTRQVAKEMLLSGRKPRNHNEQMIYNNWATIQHLRENKKMVMTPEALCEIHAMMTEGTLDDAADSGRVRIRDDIVVDYRGDTVHIPTKAALLPQRLKEFCQFANEDDEQNWIHPVVKASILHFWIGYDHPFVDGNGRTARALFYWYLLSRDYWLFEYLSISRHFLRAPGKYMRAYLYTETDHRDLTYFLVHNVRVVRSALQDLHTYLQRKQSEIADANELLRRYRDLNNRQRNIVAHALRHPEAEYTILAHKNVNNIAYATARSDLLGLVERGLMEGIKRGRTYVFIASKKIMASLRQN
jgi:Fic family protein